MPELPEVETIKRDLLKNCKNIKIKKIYIYIKKLKFKINKKITQIKNEIILKIKRYSKYILIKTTNKNYILIHLGMSGNIFIFKDNINRNKHDHIEIKLKNKIIIRYNDPRKFGFWLWTKKKQKIQKILNNLGPEPLTKEFNEKYLYKITKKKKICIHKLIMNNNIVSGIGNIYANEILFHAKIIPYTPSNKINFKKIKKIIKYTKIILKKAIILKGTIKRNICFLNKNKGLFQKKLKIYNKKNKKCFICNNIIYSIKKYNRSLFYCLKCQK